MADQSSVVPMKVETLPEAGKDPISIMIKIAENEKLSDPDKRRLFNTHRPDLLIGGAWHMLPFTL